MEEPELESVVADEEAEMRKERALGDETDECTSKMDTLRSSRAGGDDGNEADEESSEIGFKRRYVKKACSSSNTNDKELSSKRSVSKVRTSTVRSPPEMIEVDLPAYPVASVDCSTQVSNLLLL